jgi:hypothetical protein
MVEQIARIIDPNAWSVMDHYLAQTKREYAGQNVGWPADQFHDKRSMAKAREILGASHHAELVAELAEVSEVAKGCARREAQYFADRKNLLFALKRSRVALNLVPANDKRFDSTNHAAIKKATDIIDEALAKIGGES